MSEPQTNHPPPPAYRSYGAYLRERYGEKVQRISLDAGFGCPHRRGGRGEGGCIFCNPAGSGSSAADQGMSVQEQMRRGVTRLSAQGIRKFIAYFQAFCGTDAEPERLKRLYTEALSFPGVAGLSVGTRPDMLPDDKLQVLERLARSRTGEGDFEVWVELGLQSANDASLVRIRRGHDVACFDDAVVRSGRAGLKVAAHAILGLPGETRAQIMATAEHLNTLPVHGVKLHHLFVEQGTELARQYARGQVQTLDIEEYLDLAIEFLRRLRSDMVVMRLMGKAKSHDLISPVWNVRTGEWSQKVTSEMARRGCKQGDLAGD